MVHEGGAGSMEAVFPVPTSGSGSCPGFVGTGWEDRDGQGETHTLKKEAVLI